MSDLRNHQKPTLHRLEIVRHSSETIASFWAVLAFCLALAIASWAGGLYARENKLSPFWEQFAASIFGLRVAGFIGPIVFEWLLRKQLLDQTSRVLAEIVLMQKHTLTAIFSPQKINQIIELCLQIRTESEMFGSALYGWVRPYLDNSIVNRQIRYDFEDDITFLPLPESTSNISAIGKYYLVKEILYFRTKPLVSNFRVGCAQNTDGLYQLFNDPSCIYRCRVHAKVVRESEPRVG